MSPLRRAAADEGGFTLLEVVTALALAALVTALALAAFATMARGARAWAERVALVNGVHTASRRLAADLRLSHGVVQESDASWTLLTTTGPVRYDAASPTVRRNGRLIHAARHNATLSFQGRAPHPATAPPLVEGALTLTNGRDTLSAPLLVALRHAPRWPPP